MKPRRKAELTKASAVPSDQLPIDIRQQSLGPVMPSEPKLFGWLLDQAELLVPKRNEETLLTWECNALCALFVGHIVSSLNALQFGFGISERFLTPTQKQAFARRTDRLRFLDEAKALESRREFGPELYMLTKFVCADLNSRVPCVFSVSLGALPVESAMLRNLNAGSRFVGKLIAMWDQLPPVRKFLLLGGEDVLKRMHNGKIPPKRLCYAIYHVCIRGTLTSEHDNIYQYAPKTMPSKDQLHSGREFCARVRATHERCMLFSPKETLPVWAPGLQRKLSNRGMSPGSRIRQKAPRLIPARNINLGRIGV